MHGVLFDQMPTGMQATAPEPGWSRSHCPAFEVSAGGCGNAIVPLLVLEADDEDGEANQQLRAPATLFQRADCESGQDSDSAQRQHGEPGRGANRGHPDSPWYSNE